MSFSVSVTSIQDTRSPVVGPDTSVPTSPRRRRGLLLSLPVTGCVRVSFGTFLPGVGPV